MRVSARAKRGETSEDVRLVGVKDLARRLGAGLGTVAAAEKLGVDLRKAGGGSEDVSSREQLETGHAPRD